MTPVVLCLLSFVESVLWIIYSTLFGIKTFLTAFGKMIVYTIKVMLIVGAVYLGFNFLIILFTDASIFGDLFRAFWDAIDGFVGVIVIAVVIGIFVAIGTAAVAIFGFIGPILGGIGTILGYIVLAVVGGVIYVFNFLEEHFEKWYKAILTQISNRVEVRQGGSR